MVTNFITYFNSFKDVAWIRYLKIPVSLPLRTVNTINELNSLGSSLRRNKKCLRQTYETSNIEIESTFIH